MPLIAVDVSVEAGDWPDAGRLEGLARAAVDALAAELAMRGDSEVSLLFTDDDRIRVLNREWRGKDKPTNVLSFPAFDLRPGDALPPMLGDVVLAFGTVSAEAAAERKDFDHHLSHLIVHGILHLVGHDHEDPAEAEAMEALERRVLARLAISDPYDYL
jgi:probable rRNA maturation factor